MEWIVAHWSVLLLIASEILPLIPGVAANSVGQLIINALKEIAAKAKGQA